MQKFALVALSAAAVVAPAAAAAQPAPLEPEQVTLENEDAALRCAMLSQLAKGAGFFADLPNGDAMVSRLNDRMLEIARNGAPDASDDDLLAGMQAMLKEYDKLVVNGDTLKKGEMMKADFQICFERAVDLFGSDWLPDE